MGKTVTTKYDIGDKVWWRTEGEIFSGKVIGASVYINSGTTSVVYSVQISPDCKCGKNFDEIRENRIYKSEAKIEQEAEKE